MKDNFIKRPLAGTRVLIVNDSRNDGPERFDVKIEFGQVVLPVEFRETVRQRINIDFGLVQLFVLRGAEVFLADGYEDDLVTQIHDSDRMASKLGRLIRQVNPLIIMFDLDYFKQPTYGREMLLWLDKNEPDLLRKREVLWVVGSMYFAADADDSERGVSRASLKKEFPFIADLIDRNNVTAREVAAQVTELFANRLSAT